MPIKKQVINEFLNEATIKYDELLDESELVRSEGYNEAADKIEEVVIVEALNVTMKVAIVRNEIRNNELVTVSTPTGLNKGLVAKKYDNNILVYFGDGIIKRFDDAGFFQMIKGFFLLNEHIKEKSEDLRA